MSILGLIFYIQNLINVTMIKKKCRARKTDPEGMSKVNRISVYMKCVYNSTSENNKVVIQA